MASFTRSWSYMLVALVSFALLLLVSTCVVVSHYVFRHRSDTKKTEDSQQSKSGQAVARSISMEEVKDYFESNQVHQHVLWYCTGLSLAAFYLQTVMAFFYRLNEMRVFGGQNWCDDYIRLLSVLWTTGKYFMYMVCIARVHVAFKDTAYRYSNKTIFGLYVVVSAVIIPMIISAGLWSGGSTQNATGNTPSDKFTVCVSEVDPFLLTAGFIVDAIVSPTLVVLFIRPLRRVFRHSSLRESKCDSIREIEVQMLPLKYTVTVSIGVMSTITGMVLMAATDTGILVVLDSVVNMICLVTMTARWKRVYWRLCAPLLLTIAFFNCCFDDQLRRNLSRIIVHYSPAVDLEESGTELGSSKGKTATSSKESNPHVVAVHSDNSPPLEAL